MIDNPPGWLQEWSRQIGAELKDGLRENPSWIAFALRGRNRLPHLHGVGTRPVRRARTSAPCSIGRRKPSPPSPAPGARTSTRTEVPYRRRTGGRALTSLSLTLVSPPDPALHLVPFRRDGSPTRYSVARVAGETVAGRRTPRYLPDDVARGAGMRGSSSGTGARCWRPRWRPRWPGSGSGAWLGSNCAAARSALCAR